MKKLNKKGFTLVELLAVIIILALVVGITIPLVLTTSNGAKRSVFQSTANTLADWIKNQYDSISLANLGTETQLSSDFTDLCGVDGQKCVVNKNNPDSITGEVLRAKSYAAFLTAAGLKPKNYYEFVVAIDGSTGAVCVKMSMSNDGEYYYGSVGNNAFTTTETCSLSTFTQPDATGTLATTIGAYAA